MRKDQNEAYAPYTAAELAELEQDLDRKVVQNETQIRRLLATLNLYQKHYQEVITGRVVNAQIELLEAPKGESPVNVALWKGEPRSQKDDEEESSP